MSFIYFAANPMSSFQNLEFMPNYQVSMTNFVPNMTQPYSDYLQWSQFFQNENYSMYDQKVGIPQLTTTDDYSQSEVIVQTNKNPQIQKKREKKTVEKDVSSAKKNSQSNIINQFYSYFGCRERSQKIVLKAIQVSMPNSKFQQKILQVFYNTIKAINSKRGRKYVNRTMMLNYFTPDMLSENLPEIKEKLQKLDFVTLDDLCQIFRRTCQAFLKIVSIPAIMTSKRITGVSKEQHFKKRRIILKAITGY